MNARRLLQFLKTNYFLIIAIAWACWLTWSVQNVREDVDAVSSQLSVLQDTVTDADAKEELSDIRKTLTRIENRIPY